MRELEFLKIRQVKTVNLVGHEVISKKSEHAFLAAVVLGAALHMLAVAIPTDRELFFRVRGVGCRNGVCPDSLPIAFSRFVAVKLNPVVETAAQLVGGDIDAKSFNHTAPRLLGMASPISIRWDWEKQRPYMQEVRAVELRPF
jgi:hypothetical protein